MLLSEMFGVERDTDFGVEGFYGKFRVSNKTGSEYLTVSDGKGCYDIVINGSTLYGIIHTAPTGIIHLPPQLTDEQREQLKAIWTLGGRWLAMDADGMVYAYAGKPSKKTDLRYFDWIDGGLFSVLPNLKICSLVSWSDTEPYDIGNALGIKR